MNIFITGGSGFVGGAVIQRLVPRGHRVVAMSRSDRADRKLRDLGAEPIRCSLEDIAAPHLAGVDVVIHCAAFVEDWGPRDAWYQGNVLGTQAVLRAAQEAGVGRFIHIGTEAAIVHGQDVDGADETAPLAPDSPYPYCATKAQAETLVREANSPGFTTLVLRPRFVWGSGDTTLLPALEAMAQSGGFRWINEGQARSSTTHVDNLAFAVELTLDRGTPGAAYFILDDGVVTLREMLSALAETRQLTLPDKSIPRWAAAALAWGAELWWRAFALKGKPPITRHAAMVMACTCVLNDNKARRELGYAPVTSREAGLGAMASGSALRSASGAHRQS